MDKWNPALVTSVSVHSGGIFRKLKVIKPFLRLIMLPHRMGKSRCCRLFHRDSRTFFARISGIFSQRVPSKTHSPGMVSTNRTPFSQPGLPTRPFLHVRNKKLFSAGSPGNVTTPWGRGRTGKSWVFVFYRHHHYRFPAASGVEITFHGLHE